jgi:hypothetical protein
MSFPIFSQSDTVSEDLVCIPTIQAKQIASDLVKYDLCRMERDSLLLQVNDLNSIIEQNDVLINQFKTTTDSLMFINQSLVDKTTYQSLEIVSKEDKIKRLRNTRNVTILTTVLTAILPVVLSKE